METEKKVHIPSSRLSFIELEYGGMDGLKTMMSTFHQFARFG